MDSRVAIIAVIIKNPESVAVFNEILHEHSEYIIGRMGIPYRSKKINVVSVAVDAPRDVINSLAGKIGKLAGVSAKTLYSDVSDNKEDA